MKKNCKITGKEFEITDKDLEFYKKVWVPTPTLCPEERQRRRMTWRNDRIFYKRICDFSGKKIISMYDAGTEFPVYNQDEWWSDKWDALNYGQDFDFERPFFEQFGKLLSKVPRISLINKLPENAEYCNFALGNKNSYLLFTSWENEDCAYLNRAWNCNNTLDGINVKDCDLCYEVSDSTNCFKSLYITNCKDCSDSMYSENLINCSYCFGCSNLTNKQYHIGNKPVAKENYQEKVNELLSDKKLLAEFLKNQKDKQFHKDIQGKQNQNCSGNFLSYSKDSDFCFDASHLEDCRYCSNITESKNVYDTDNDDHSELVYESIGSEQNYLHLFNDISWFNKHLLYSSLCFHSENSFGCIGLKNKEFCILNKQYTKEEYNVLLPKIIAHMRNTWEWGEFFPLSLSPFSYNESVAQDFYPLTSESVEQFGGKWKIKDASAQYHWSRKVLPENIDDVSDDIVKEVLTCDCCEKNYRIIGLELSLYRKLWVSVPKNCFNCRYDQRLLKKRNRTLYERSCDGCSNNILSIYPKSSWKTVYCEGCYEHEID